MPHRHGSAFKSMRIARMQERLSSSPSGPSGLIEASAPSEGPAWFDLLAWKGRPLAPDWEAGMSHPSQRLQVSDSKALHAYTDGLRPSSSLTGPMGVIVQPRFGGHRCTRPGMCDYTESECSALG